MLSTGVRPGPNRRHASQRRHPRRWLVTLVLMTVLLTACMPGAPGAGSTGTSSGGSLKVRILVTITDRCCLNYIPILIGGHLGVFEKNGLDVEWIPQVPGASPAMAATLSGQADVTVISSAGAVAAAGAGRPARIMSVQTLDVWPGMAVQPEVAQKLAAKGATPKSPWQEKMRALAGLRVFGNSAGGPAEIRLRKLLSTSGLDPDKDVTFQPGTPESGNAAWRSRQLDTFTCCEPATFQLVPDAVVWIAPGEIDLPIKGAGEILATTEEYAKANPETLKRILNVQKEMRKMIVAAGPGTKEREDLLRGLEKQYPSVPPELIATSFDTGRMVFDVENELTRQVAQDTIDSYNESAPVKVNITAEDLGAAGFLKD